MSEKRYFVRYQTYKYDSESHEEFESLDQVITFLTGHATDPDFRFDVIYGERIEFEPAEIIKSYRPKKEH